MAVETQPQSGKEAASSCHESSVAHQTATAVAETIGPPTEQLMEEVLRRENLFAALKRVKSNKGSAGVDRMRVNELPEFLKENWPTIREQLLSETYTPSPVREVYLPKPGGGMRMLGIPAALDRLITQAITQVIGPIFDLDFSEHSYGFRPGRSAHQGVEQAREFVEQGNRWVVDLDLEKFFDQVNHDKLMSRVARKVKDKRLLRLIRRYLSTGIMQDGMVSIREAGTPQGSPLSPLLSNIILDDFDKELERRGHRFCRYADDTNVYVRSKRAGERVMKSLIHFLESKLLLKVNRDKSAVDRPWKRKFLGYSMTNHLKPKLKPAPESVKRAKDKIREITHRGRGRNIEHVIKEVNRFVRGWVGYFRLSTVKQAFVSIDQWLRRRLRKILWEQWKKPKTRYRKLVALGLNAVRARKATATGRKAWWNAGASHMHGAVSNGKLTQWGLLGFLPQLQSWQRCT